MAAALVQTEGQVAGGKDIFLRLIDKLVFAVTLLLALQVPVLADHYHQFLAGYYESTRQQIEGYEATARRHQYPNLQAMIDDHRRNPTPSVRTDAEQKQQTLIHYGELAQALKLFEQGNLLEKAGYMFSPTRLGMLHQTIANFKPGLPLTPEGLGFGVLVGLILNTILLLPWVGRNRRRPTS